MEKIVNIIKKRMPTKPKIESEITICTSLDPPHLPEFVWTCPRCGEEVWGKKTNWPADRCSHCGQRIGWNIVKEGENL